MADSALVVAKEVFYHRNSNNFTMWEWLNDEEVLFNFIHILFLFNFIHIN